jgi:hypothetical protein
MKKMNLLIAILILFSIQFNLSFATDLKIKPKTATTPAKSTPTQLSQTLPDLVVEKVWLDEKCQINFQLSNIGPGSIPEPQHLQGMVRVYFGESHEDFFFRNANRSNKKPVDATGVLKNPKNSIQYNTGIKLNSAVKIVVSIDENQKISESNIKNNKSASLTLTPTCSTTREKNLQPQKAAPQRSQRIQALIIDLEKSTKAEDLERAFKRASLNKQELKEFESILEQGTLGQKIQRIVMQTRIDKRATVEEKKNQILESIHAFNSSQSERQQLMLRQETQQAMEEINRLRATAPVIRTPVAGGHSFSSSPSDARPLPAGSAIQSVSPTNLEPGQTFVVNGSGFGSAKGRLTIIIGRDLFTCDILIWSDTHITAVLPLQVQEAVREGELNGLVWVKLGDGETGPWTEVTFIPDFSRLVPEITSLSPTSFPMAERQMFVISGRNFLSQQPGRAILRFQVGRGEILEAGLIIAEWTDTYIMATIGWLSDHIPLAPPNAILIVRNHLGLEKTHIIEFEYPLERRAYFFKLPAKVTCEVWGTEWDGEDKPSWICLAGQKKKFRTYLPHGWINIQRGEVIEYGADVITDGGLGKGWRWLERPHGSKASHSVEVWADLYSWIDLQTWIIVEGRGMRLYDSRHTLEEY